MTLLRSAVSRTLGTLAVAAALSLSPPVHAATGGASVPGVGAGTAVPEPAPAVEPAPQAAEQVTLARPIPAIPVLATPSRRAEDPATRDLAALAQPSSIAAVDGHVVYVRQHMGRTELVDVGDPGNPRILLSGTREFGVPIAGHDSGGHPVVVLSTCAGTEEVVQQGQAPRCPLRSVDLTDGTSQPLPATTGAFAGDLAGDQLVFSRRGGKDGTRLYESDGSSAKLLPLPRLGRSGDGWLPSHGKPVGGSVRVSALDVGADGRIAAVIEYAAKKPAYSSSLWVRSAAGSWRRITTLGTQRTGLGTRQVFAPSLVEGGVQAYVEGIIETPSFVGRWTDAGAQTAKLSLRRSIGRATILHSAAYDGNRLVFVDWLPGVPCGSEGALACGLRAAGPIRID